MTSMSPMRAIASAAIRSSAGRKRLANGAPRQHAGQHLVSRVPAARFYSRDGNQSPPSSKNPFEVQFHPEDEDAIFQRKRAAKASAGSTLIPHEAEIQDEIQLLHAEMAGIFGEELEEYEGSSSSSNEDLVSKDSQAAQRESPAAERSLDAYHPSSAFNLQNDQSTAHSITATTNRATTRSSIPQRSNFQEQGRLNKSHILVLQGPCSYVRNKAIGSNKPKHQLLGDIHRAAAQLGSSITCRNSNHEGEILDWLLDADEGSSIILCWNARLSESPVVVRALELLDSHAVNVIVVSPLGVEHGPLPASVRGVISGLDANTVEIALHAAKALNEP